MRSLLVLTLMCFSLNVMAEDFYGTKCDSKDTDEMKCAICAVVSELGADNSSATKKPETREILMRVILSRAKILNRTLCQVAYSRGAFPAIYRTKVPAEASVANTLKKIKDAQKKGPNGFCTYSLNPKAENKRARLVSDGITFFKCDPVQKVESIPSAPPKAPANTGTPGIAPEDN